MRCCPKYIIINFNIFFNPIFPCFAQISISLREWQQNLFFRQISELWLVHYYSIQQSVFYYLLQTQFFRQVNICQIIHEEHLLSMSISVRAFPIPEQSGKLQRNQLCKAISANRIKPYFQLRKTVILLTICPDFISSNSAGLFSAAPSLFK